MSPSDPPLRKRLRRHEHSHHLRFLTFSTYRRLPLFLNPRIRDLFAQHLAAARDQFKFHLYAWVVMPEHVHLLLWPCLPEHPVSAVLRTFKGDFADEVIARWQSLGARVLDRLVTPQGKPRFWQRGGGYDRNIFSRAVLAETIEYIHGNPVKRGLVAKPEDWAWSSARWYAGLRDAEAPAEIAMDPLPPKRPGHT